MGNLKRVWLILFLVSGAVVSVSAQDFPLKLAQVDSSAIQKLGSDDVAERASLLKSLVFHVPQSCTLELGLRHDLSSDDYVFVVEKILEKDLRSLNEKLKGETWTFLSHLITRFEMKKFAGSVASYVDDPDWQIQTSVVQTLRRLRAAELDGKISPLLDAIHPYVRHLTLETLIEFKSLKATPALISKLREKDPSARYWALDKLAEIGAVEAGSVIAGRLKDEENEDIKYWILDALTRLNSKDQAAAVWQFRKENTNKRLDGFSVAALMQFEQRAAVPIVIESMKAIAAGEQEFHIMEFLRKLKPKFFIPELILIHNTKANFMADPESEKRFRRGVLQLLLEYRSPLAIPVYRDNLIDKYYQPGRPNSHVAELLYELNAVEALDDLIISFTELMKSSGSDNDHLAGQFGIVLAKFGDKRTWKMLIEYLDKTAYYNREQIVIELNKHLDGRLWKETHNRKPTQLLAPVKPLVESLVRESGIRVTMPEIPRTDTCSLEPTNDKDAIACAYSDPNRSMHDTLLTIISILNSRKRGQYTFVYDKGSIRILKVTDAIEFWKSNILGKLS